MARECSRVLIGAYLNFTALSNCLLQLDKDVILLCAGWKNKFNLEDTLFAGALAGKLIGSGHYQTICDSAIAAVDLYNYASRDLMAYVDKVAQRSRLRKNKLDDVIEYCHTFDVTGVIPALREDFLEVLSV